MIIHLEGRCFCISVKAFGGGGHSVSLLQEDPHPNFGDREGGLNLAGEFSWVLHPQNGCEL